MNKRSSLIKYAWLSLAAAVITMGLKAVGCLLTQSVSKLSDAEVIPAATIFTHIEPLEDPRSWTDQQLDRDG